MYKKACIIFLYIIRSIIFFIFNEFIIAVFYALAYLVVYRFVGNSKMKST